METFQFAQDANQKKSSINKDEVKLLLEIVDRWGWNENVTSLATAAKTQDEQTLCFNYLGPAWQNMSFKEAVRKSYSYAWETGFIPSTHYDFFDDRDEEWYRRRQERVNNLIKSNREKRQK